MVARSLLPQDGLWEAQLDRECHKHSLGMFPMARDSRPRIALAAAVQVLTTQLHLRRFAGVLRMPDGSAHCQVQLERTDTHYIESIHTPFLYPSLHLIRDHLWRAN